MESFAATQRKACELARIPRSTFRYLADVESDTQLKTRLTELAQEQPRYGYRRLAPGGHSLWPVHPISSGPSISFMTG